MRGRVLGGLRHRADAGWWRAVAAAALLIPSALSAQERPAAAQAPAARTHTVKKGDTLWDLAQQYLGDAFQWPEIYRLNRDVVEDPHWIYPGEILRIPGAVSAQAPAPEAAPQPAPAPAPAQAPAPEQRPVNSNITVFSPVQRSLSDEVSLVDEESKPVVRAGEIVGAPWVETKGAPMNSGHLLGSRELPGIAAHGERARYQLAEQLLATLPGDRPGTIGERYFAVRKGPELEEMGQVLIPTAILEVVRPARNGDAAIVVPVRLYEGLSVDHRIVPYDPNMLRVGTTLADATPAERIEGHIRWISQDPVLPSIGRFTVLDISAIRGVRPGDQFEVFIPRQEIKPDAPLRPETPVARIQVVRVTPFGSTAVILGQDQPKIEVGQSVRRIATLR